jgi:hypothetical protein
MKLVDDNLMVVTGKHLRLEICTIYRHTYLTFSATFDSFILLASTPQLLPVVENEGCNHLRLETSSLERTFPFVLMHNLCSVHFHSLNM